MNEANICWARQLVVLGKLAIHARQFKEALDILAKATYILDSELGFENEILKYEKEASNNNESTKKRVRSV